MFVCYRNTSDTDLKFIQTIENLEECMINGNIYLTDKETLNILKEIDEINIKTKKNLNRIRVKNGFAKVTRNGRKWNFINTRGELLWKGDEWFALCDDFDNGFARVELNGRAFMIDTKGQLHNLNETKQRTLRLTESEFRKLIKESVRKTLYKRML